MKRIVSTQVIDRPVDAVFRFYAVDHVRNHPRWDSDMELWLEVDAPIAVGTVIHRRNRRSGAPVEGTMLVTELEANRAIAMEIHDGPAVSHGRSTFEALDDGRTRLTTVIEIPWMDSETDTSFIERRLEHVAAIRRQLVEAET